MSPMRVFLTLLVILSAVSGSSRASAADFYPVTAADKKFLAEVVDAVGRRDTAWIADHMAYPLSTVASNHDPRRAGQWTKAHGERLVWSKKEFKAIVARKLTVSLRARIATAAREPLFKNWQGVMIGDGIIWFSELKTGPNSPWRYRILAIGHFAFQPPSEIIASPN